MIAYRPRRKTLGHVPLMGIDPGERYNGVPEGARFDRFDRFAEVRQFEACLLTFRHAACTTLPGDCMP